MKLLKYLSFGLIAFVCGLLVFATVFEKLYGSLLAHQHIYGAWWFAALWAVCAMVWLAYVLKKKLFLRPAVFLLHLSFLLILAGAGITRIFGAQGSLHLRLGECANRFANHEWHAEPLPFSLRLDEFKVACHPGTQTPMDYVSRVSLWNEGEGDTLSREISMNHILKHRGYRFYQASYDPDLGGSVLAVSHDPWGIGFTYAGYVLLLVAMVAVLLDKECGFRKLLRHPAWVRSLAVCVLFAWGGKASAAKTDPPALPKDLAAELGNLHVYYNGRICPLNTLAHDFCVKLTKHHSYKGLNADQFLSGWLFYHDEWLGEHLAEGGEDLRSQERRALIDMAGSQHLLRIFPHIDEAPQRLRWSSPPDPLPSNLGGDTVIFIRLSIDYLRELVRQEHHEEALALIRKIGLWQERQAGEVLPSKARFAAEKFYNRCNRPIVAAVAFLLFGIAAFFLRRPIFKRVLLVLLCGGLAYLLLTLALRGWICGYLPMANGYETMQVIACFALLAALLGRNKSEWLPAFGLVVAGLAMTVSMMGASNPQITPLMPVLASPLLSVHVMLMMVAYTLFAFMMLNGIAGLCLHRHKPEASLRLSLTSRVLLYPAVFCLAAGIFIGAVWANVSWGRYWGWDPKEVWALITLLVYAFAFHAESLPRFSRPCFFHVFCILAFACVLITYFGVNFLLGGMHGYV